MVEPVAVFVAGALATACGFGAAKAHKAPKEMLAKTTTNREMAVLIRGRTILGIESISVQGAVSD